MKKYGECTCEEGKHYNNADCMSRDNYTKCSDCDYDIIQGVEMLQLFTALKHNKDKEKLRE